MELWGYILHSVITFTKGNGFVFPTPGCVFWFCWKCFAFSVFGSELVYILYYNNIRGAKRSVYSIQDKHETILIIYMKLKSE
jgi:hypothetical protein